MAANEFTWTIEELEDEFRNITGRQSTSDITDANIHKRINQYYTEEFPLEVYVELLRDWFTQSTSATDNGNYSLGQTTLDIEEPLTRDNTEIVLYRNKAQFFLDYPDDEQYITAPGLAIGSSDTTKVKHDAFTYDIQGDSYYKASSEVAFSGLSTVPQNKYGAFSLKIDEDGTITIAEADDNATGYDSPGLALEGLDVADSDSCYMGFVTVISTDSGGFVPGTTALDDSAVTDTYTDGKFEERGDPEAALIFDEYLYVRPRADRVMQLKAPKIVRPAALDTGETPLDIAWGPAIVIGAALKYIQTNMHDYEMNMIERLELEQERLQNRINRKMLIHKYRGYAVPSY